MDIPRIIAGRFRIDCEIGRGGMGAVYRASHLGLERPVAVKVLKKEVASDPEVAERFMREARTMARLRHPRAAMIFDAGRLADGRPFIVMEYAEGRTLAEALQADGPFAPPRAVRVAAEICEVLAEAHAIGIVHRDLKPSNIMLTDRGVCVLDFGIAKVLAGGDEATRTHPTTESGLVIGTPRYMSPEQCLGQKVGPASDLYSVGVLVYEMLTGRPPFIDGLAAAVLVKQATQAPPPLVAACPDAPRELSLAVHTLLSKNPASRPRTASEARALLESAVAPRPRGAASAVETAPFASTIDILDTARRATFVRAAAACAILAMLATVIVAWAGRAAARSKRMQPPPWSAQAAPLARSQSTTAPPAAARASAPRVQTPPARAASFRPVSTTSQSALRLATAASGRGAVSDARFIRVASGQGVAAIHDEAGKGRTHLFVMQGRGERLRVTGRAPLDVEGFRGARWTQEIVDLDGDGFHEVLCTGTLARGAAAARRYVLYVPRTRQTYSLSVAPRTARHSARLVKWSPNALRTAARPFRAALSQRASTRLL